MSKMLEIIEGYKRSYPQLIGLKTDEEFRELAVSSVIEFLEQNKTAGVSYLNDIHEGIQLHLVYLKGYIRLKYRDDHPAELEAIEDAHRELLTTVATLKALGNLYEDKQRYSPEAAKAFQDELAEDSRYQTDHAYDE